MKVCKRCGREVEHVSRRGLCESCSMTLLLNAIRSLKEKKGITYDKWLRGVGRAMEKERSRRSRRRHG